MTAKTRNSILLVVTLLFFGACSKDDDQTAEVFRRRVTPALLPAPSCDDTTDDGVFESWNASEEHLILVADHVVRPSGTHVPGVISDIRMPDRRISVNTPVFQWNASIDTGVVFHMSFTLVDKDGGRVQAMADETSGAAATAPGRKNFVSQLYGDPLTPGCKRLYYCGFKTGSSSRPLSSGQTPIDTMKLLYQGHFDVEIY